MLITIYLRSFSNLLLMHIIQLFFLCLLAYIVGWGALAWLLTDLINRSIGMSAADGVMMHLLGGAGGMMLAWFLFPLLYPILISFFDQKIAAIIEQHDYPHLPPAKPPFWPTIAQDLWFSVKAIGLNIIFLPLYFVPLVGFCFYYGLNGYLLGTQIFRMAAGRRSTPDEVKRFQHQSRGAIFIIGASISVSATIPVLNLAAPFIGIIAMIHLYHALNKPALVY